MRRGRRILLLPFLALGLSCSSGEPPDDDGNPPPDVNTISVRNNEYVPAAIMIEAADSVHFVWAASSTNHDVVPAAANAPLPSSPGAPLLLHAPQDFWVVFPSAGVFRFGCSAHSNILASTGTLSGMTGTVTVQ